MKSDYDTYVFLSKRNYVQLNSGVVEKYFKSPEAAVFETEMLERLLRLGVRVPAVIKQEDCVLKMSYISGITIPDLLENLEITQDQYKLEKAADGIMGWLEDFYNAVDTKGMGEIRGDVNGRNFLFDGEYVWGVDFEKRVRGKKEQDIGRLIAFILTYNPPGTQIKQLFADRVIYKAVQTLKADEEAIRHYQGMELDAMKKRRCTVKT